MQKQKDSIRLIAILAMVFAVNYLGSFVAKTFGLPIFLDSAGTIFGVILGGFMIGASGGIIYNFFTVLTTGQVESSIWAFSSIFIAFIVWHLLKTKKLKLINYESVFMASVVLAVANSLLTTALSLTFLHGTETFPAAVTLQTALSKLFSNSIFNLALTHLVIEVIDKSLVFLLVYWAYKLYKKKALNYKGIFLPAAVIIVVIAFTACMNAITRI